jgi:hypothetical protein
VPAPADLGFSNYLGTTMSRIKLTSLLLAIGACLLLPLAAQSASYDNHVDCSSAKNWSSSERYKKDDVAIYQYASYRELSLFKCTKDECMGNIENEPGTSGSNWEHLGLCK